MKWHNTKLDKLPKDKQQVLISSEGINYIALFDSNRKIFTVQTKTKIKQFKAEQPQLYWTEYTTPGKDT